MNSNSITGCLITVTSLERRTIIALAIHGMRRSSVQS
jgi:hypothetical protein